MRALKISAGIWYLGAVGDRFVKQGYRPDKTIAERFKIAGAIAGVQGIELHYPTELSDNNFLELKKLANGLGLKYVMITPHLWVDPETCSGESKQSNVNSS